MKVRGTGEWEVVAIDWTDPEAWQELRDMDAVEAAETSRLTFTAWEPVWLEQSVTCMWFRRRLMRP